MEKNGGLPNRGRKAVGQKELFLGTANLTDVDVSVWGLNRTLESDGPHCCSPIGEYWPTRKTLRGITTEGEGGEFKLKITDRD